MSILEAFGFELARIQGSHHIMRRVVTFESEDGEEYQQEQTISVPMHGRKQIPIGTLKKIYRDICRFADEVEVRPHFYGG